MIAAITGKRVLLVRTYFRHSNADDCSKFVTKLLEKINTGQPRRGYTFFGDNEHVYQAAITKLSFNNTPTIVLMETVNSIQCTL